MTEFKIKHDSAPKLMKINAETGEDLGINLNKGKGKANYADFFSNDLSANDFNDFNDIPEEDGIDFIANEDKKVEDSERSLVDFNEDGSDANSVMMENRYLNDSDHGSIAPSQPELTYEEIQIQKAAELANLKRLAKEGYLPAYKLGPEHSLNTIKSEVLRLTKEKDVDDGIKMCKTALMFCVKGIEGGSQMYKPMGYDISIKGWSEVHYQEQDNYESILGDIYTKWAPSGEVAPEIKLILMLGGSASNFYMNKLMIDKMSQDPAQMQEMVNNFMRNNGQQPNQSDTKKPKMKGPSMDTDDLFNNLQMDDTASEFSDSVSDFSIASGASSIERTIKLPAKKVVKAKPKKAAAKPAAEKKPRGRPKKVKE